MSLKRTLTAEEHAALVPAQQTFYVAAADGNGFALDVEADPAVRTLQTSIGEFRENNITLQRQMEELRAQRQPPPENAALEERVADLTRIVTEEREATARERSARSEDRFQIRVAEIGSKNGVRQEAVSDMVSRAKQSGFRVVEADGTVAAFRGENAVMSRRDPSVRLTLTEWMHDQRRDGGGHLFKPSKGSDGLPQESKGTIIDGVLHNPSEAEFGKNLADIASGKIQVSDNHE